MTMHLGYKRAHADRPSFRWCQRCHMPSQGNICQSCKTQPPAKRDAVISDPDPLPAAWAAYSPDMSGNSYLPTDGLTTDAITHPALMWAISQGTYTITREYWRSEYQGRLDPTTQRSIMDYMRERGGTGGLHNCRIISPTMDLSITCMGERTTIELVDYGTPNTMPADAAAPAVEIGGVAW